MAGVENDYTEYIEGDDGEWYWHRRAGNNKNIAVGGEGFEDRDNAVTSYNRARESFVHDAGIGVAPLAAPIPVLVTEQTSYKWRDVVFFVLMGAIIGFIIGVTVVG